MKLSAATPDRLGGDVEGPDYLEGAPIELVDPLADQLRAGALSARDGDPLADD